MQLPIGYAQLLFKVAGANIFWLKTGFFLYFFPTMCVCASKNMIPLRKEIPILVSCFSSPFFWHFFHQRHPSTNPSSACLFFFSDNNGKSKAVRERERRRVISANKSITIGRLFFPKIGNWKKDLNGLNGENNELKGEPFYKNFFSTIFTQSTHPAVTIEGPLSIV